MTTIDQSAVLPPFRNPPTPTLTFDGPTATLTGVRWVWLGRCFRCRETTYVTTDGGTITVGLDDYRSHSGKTKRTTWTRKDRPTRLAELPTGCEHCGKAQVFPREDNFCDGYPHGESATMSQAYAALRDQYPELAAKADATDAARRARS